MSHSVEKLVWLLETLIPHISPWALFFTSFCHWYQSTILSFWCSGFLFTFPNNTVLISFCLLMKIHSKLEYLTITSIHHIEAKLYYYKSSLFCSTPKESTWVESLAHKYDICLQCKKAIHQNKGLLCLPSAKPGLSILFLGLQHNLDQRPRKPAKPPNGAQRESSFLPRVTTRTLQEVTGEQEVLRILYWKGSRVCLTFSVWSSARWGARWSSKP